MRRRAYNVLFDGNAPSVLVESVYLTNPAEATALQEGAEMEGSRRQQIVKGLARGIVNYFVTLAQPPFATRSARETGLSHGEK